ncbi:hypothetical protein [Enterococcus avium]|uniref:hypothetical protein n=1 Tax=Enterococcus avium TaxID=33945 RepID=UPI002891C762|nr:hypothetical protein [Enterococcus avium]MDT2461481.1 hypothetical protein [Enterococcus avium]
MNDFNEAVLTISVNADVAEVYKKAIESENSPNGLREHWNGNYAYVVIEEMYEKSDNQTNSDRFKRVLKDAHIVDGSNTWRPFVWNPYRKPDLPDYVKKDSVELTIQLLSHTLPNLKETVSWYEATGAKVIYTNYREK